MWLPNIGALADFTEDMMLTTSGSTTDGAGLEILYAMDSIARFAKLTCPSMGWTQVFTLRTERRMFLADGVPADSTGLAV